MDEKRFPCFFTAFRELGLDKVRTEAGTIFKEEELLDIAADLEEDALVVFQEFLLEEMVYNDDGDLILLPSHKRCFSHSLSLLATTDIKKDKFPENLLYE